ncbi:unnamed protein product, partial [Prorocentrum cordatum]
MVLPFRFSSSHHRPFWRDRVERLRLEGLRGSSFMRHLYADSGDYFGAWQRIDVPLHVSAEYCLVLDHDTLFSRPVRFWDFSARFTPKLAFSTDLEERSRSPLNAGVTWMNIPFMRESLPAFHSFIFNHTRAEFQNLTSHSGAYLEFYGREVKFLPQRFAMKPYFRNTRDWKDKSLIHFNGLRPHDLLHYWFTGSCEPEKCYLIFRFDWHRYLNQCACIQLWGAAATREGASIVDNYCRNAVPNQSLSCLGAFERLRGVEHEANSSICDEFIRKVSTHNVCTAETAS